LDLVDELEEPAAIAVDAKIMKLITTAITNLINIVSSPGIPIVADKLDR
jgi:hypothetical protein